MTTSSRSRRRSFAAAGLAFLLLATSCGQDDPDVTTATGGTGSISPPVVIRVGADGGSASTAAAEDRGADMAMAPWVIVDYVVGATLPDMPGEANGWRYPGDVTPDSAALGAIADALGVTGDVIEVPDDLGGGWRIGPDDGSAPAIHVSADGQLSWWFSPTWTDGGGVRSSAGCAYVDPVEPALEPGVADEGAAGSGGEDTPAVDVPAEECVYEEPVPPAGVLSAAEAEAKARSLLAEMGVDVSTLEFEPYADDWTASVTAYVRLNGVKAPVTFGFGFGAEGRLESANGVLATPLEVGPYPLVSVDDALQRLRDGYGGWGYPMPLADTARAEPAVGAPDIAIEPAICDSELGDCVPVEPEEITVTIVDVRLDLWWVWDTDGTVWLLPAYSFIDADGGTHTVPAVTDDYLVVEEPTVTEPDPDTTEPGTEPDPDTGVSSEPPPVDPGTDPEPEPTPIPDEEASTLVGLTEEEAGALAEATGWTVRVVARDGEYFAVTEDYSFTRVNLVIVDDIVAEVTVG